jgi:hypothetical protein
MRHDVELHDPERQMPPSHAVPFERGAHTAFCAGPSWQVWHESSGFAEPIGKTVSPLTQTLVEQAPPTQNPNSHAIPSVTGVHAVDAVGS